MATLSPTRLLVMDGHGLEAIESYSEEQIFATLFSPALLVSQISTSHWHECIGDPIQADVILDRFIHNSHHFVLKWDSMRKERII